MKLIAIASVAAGLALAGSASAADLIIGGQFAGGGSSYQTYGNCNGGVPGSGPNSTCGTFTFDDWTVAPNTSVDLIGGYWQAPPGGGGSVDLDGVTEGGISQTFDTVAGHRYELTFYLAGNPDDGAGMKTVGVSVGLGSATYTFDETGTDTHNDMGWTPETLFFTAGPGPTTTLDFGSETSGSFGPVIGDVSVSAAPEPATWGLMLLGVGMAGGALRLSRESRRSSGSRVA